MKCWLSGCDEAMRIRIDGGAVGVQIEQQCRSAMLLVTEKHRPILFQCSQQLLHSLLKYLDEASNSLHTAIENQKQFYLVILLFCRSSSEQSLRPHLQSQTRKYYSITVYTPFTRLQACPYSIVLHTFLLEHRSVSGAELSGPALLGTLHNRAARSIFDGITELSFISILNNILNTFHKTLHQKNCRNLRIFEFSSSNIMAVCICHINRH